MSLFERHLAAPIREALQDTPAVLVNGPRQSGKTTLVRQMAAEMATAGANGQMAYYTLDSSSTLSTAEEDPQGFIETIDSAIIDEIQRAPMLMLAIKLSIDQDRRPGRFLLTGSANVLALPQIADSLAGRMETHTLLPLSQSEMQGRANDFLQCAKAQQWRADYERGNLQERVLAGGYPEMRERKTLARRQVWAKAYINHIMERDVQDIARIDQLIQMPSLLNLLATQSGQLLNLTQWGAQLKLDSKTVDRYVGVLERLYLVQRLHAWGRHEANRLIKTPKLHFLDAGLQGALTRLSPELLMTQRARWGATLETWVYGELRKAIALSPDFWVMSHYRDKDQLEVDFVLEDSLRQVIGIEVKAAASIQAQDFKGLKRLQAQAGDDFITGILLYDGTHAYPFGDRLWAVPLSAL
jgi:predicted AAA+ superfamily ATPase